jgi:hypothetical protein
MYDQDKIEEENTEYVDEGLSVSSYARYIPKQGSSDPGLVCAPRANVVPRAMVN